MLGTVRAISSVYTRLALKRAGVALVGGVIEKPGKACDAEFAIIALKAAFGTNITYALVQFKAY